MHYNYVENLVTLSRRSRDDNQWPPGKGQLRVVTHGDSQPV